MKKRIGLALKIIFPCLQLLIFSCPPCPLTHTGITFQVTSLLASYPITLLSPSVSFIDGGEIDLVTEQFGDSTAIWANYDLAQFSNRILVFSIALKDHTGRQDNFFLDTIRLKENSVIDYSLSLSHSLKSSNNLLPQKYYPIGDKTKNESDTMTTVYNYMDTFCR